jgi:Rieske Fe-S protein
MSNQAPVPLPLWSRAWIVAIGSVSVLASVSLIAVVAIYSRPPTNAANEAIVDVGVQISEIPIGQAVQFAAPPGIGFEMIDGGGSNRAGDSATAGWLVHSEHGLIALAGNSSHLGCSVNFNAAAAQFQDPCGGSFFATDGAVLHGPAMFPLSHLAWRAIGAATIAVKTVAAARQ